MPKSSLRAAADAAILQCIIYDSKSRKRAIVVYMCGPEAFWADHVLNLFDKDKARPCPKWLIEQLQNMPADAVHYDYRGREVGPERAPGSAVQDTVPVATVPEGESLGDDESSIQQSRG